MQNLADIKSKTRSIKLQNHGGQPLLFSSACNLSHLCFLLILFVLDHYRLPQGQDEWSAALLRVLHCEEGGRGDLPLCRLCCSGEQQGWIRLVIFFLYNSVLYTNFLYHIL